MLQRLGLIVLLFVTACNGEDTPDSNTPPAAPISDSTGRPDSAEAKPVPGYEGDLKAIIDRAVEQYRKAKTYEDTLAYSYDAEIEGDVPLPDDGEMSYAYQAPNRVRLHVDSFTLVSNGKKAWQYIDLLGQMVESPAPEKLDITDMEINRFGVLEEVRHPVAVLHLMPATRPELVFGEVKRYLKSEAAQLDDRAGKRIYGVTSEPNSRVAGSKPSEIPFDVWFDDRTGLIGQIRYDKTDLLKSMVEQARVPDIKVRQLIHVFRLREVQFDQELAEERFEFTPPAYARKVEEFRFPPTRDGMQQLLVGRPAPSFNGKDFEGKFLSSEDLKGRVVLLDFWASWCGPCRMVMPTLQKLHEKYKDKPVTIIGVNSDTGRDRATSEQIIESLALTYRQFFDERDRLAGAFRVGSIPCIALIGKDGIIQAIHTGVSFDEERRLVREIDMLLDGKSLFDRQAAAGR